ncbi:conserved hypothetical protein [Luminiphilus syltensis NOR5-1B]|uniref:Uncharacterized protein n=1 Tax=Luminiphilus syltensis NOR5-1B TaxID=565045 RepID=B8KXI3_9GAMM|nr:hypothetical protein [Luminiphilus syltensis]EED35953.1 conserved hypothetical protein [Luminiphilus syltensis NOR5-1B]
MGTLVVATQYSRILNAFWFFRLSLAVELVTAAGVIGVLAFSLTPALALFVYMGYQITFAFGSYLVRCETLLIPEQARLTQLDVAKQAGYLVGLGCAWGGYLAMEHYFSIADKLAQVRLMHYPLLLVEITTVLLLILAFSRSGSAIRNR